MFPATARTGELPRAPPPVFLAEMVACSTRRLKSCSHLHCRRDREEQGECPADPALVNNKWKLGSAPRPQVQHFPVRVNMRLTTALAAPILSARGLWLSGFMSSKE